MEVIDCVSFNGEYDLFKLRYNILKDYVDRFIVVEAPTTFTAKKKPIYARLPGPFETPIAEWPKVKSYIIDENYTLEERTLAENSPNTVGAPHWKREFLQKESIKKALLGTNSFDLVFIGDCDEIWNPAHLGFYRLANKPEKIHLYVYTYYLNNRSDEEFWGTVYGTYQSFKYRCLNHIRTRAKKLHSYMGWHFTSLRGALKQKLTDSYTEESYATPWVLDNLEENIDNNKDFLGRDFNYWLDESAWPEYLKENKEEYKHLIK